jgi:DNA-binding NtrC family response regulator
VIVGESTPETDINIAVLDDDLDFRTYIEDLLRDEGRFAVHTYAHPADLLHDAAQRPPDIVLLDMKMGEFRGEKVLEQLLGRWPQVCVIIITGYPSLEDMRATFKMKVFDYLAKPFSMHQLRQTLANAIEAYGLGRTDYDRLRERLGHRIKVLRAEHDWSLKDLAGLTQLSVSQISSIERGANLPSMESFLAICRAFDRKPSDMLASIEF